MIAFYNGVSGMIAHQEGLNVTSHNVANVNTVGYKASRSSFNDLLHTKMNTKVEGENLVGHGVKHQDSDLIFSQSGMNLTDAPLDFAIKGDGLFAVKNERGEIQYTRNGAFALSINGKTIELVSSDGSYVLDSRGQNIKIPIKEGTENTPDLEGLAKKIGVYTVPNPFGLETFEGSRFMVTAQSGEAEAMKEPGEALVQGMLEFSSVDLGLEMVKVIESQRAFQVNAKLVQTADELENTVNNLR